jgi:phosphocarrier protein
MIKKELIIKNNSGLHARPASIFVKECCKFPCNIVLVANGKDYNAKSILSVLSAGIICGTTVQLVCNGDQEFEALGSVALAVELGLGE